LTNDYVHGDKIHVSKVILYSFSSCSEIVPVGIVTSEKLRGQKSLWQRLWCHRCAVNHDMRSFCYDPEVGPDPEYWSRLRQDSALFFWTRTQSQKFRKKRTRIRSHFFQFRQ